MNKNEFSELLHQCSKLSYDFALKYVINELPEKFMYQLNINAPYEELIEDEECFPELTTKGQEYTDPMTHNSVVDELWRNGKVPEWIDISVFRTDKEYTYFTLTCCNRFTAKNELYYYIRNDNGPFGIKSPVFPPEWEFEDKNKNKKFDLETRQRLFHKETFLDKLTKLIKNKD